MWWQQATDRLSHLRYRIALQNRLLIDALLVLVGLALIKWGGTSTIDVVGALTSLLGAILFFINMRERRVRSLATHIVENENFLDNLLSAKLPDGFELFYGSTQYSTPSPEINLKEARPYITNSAINEQMDGSRNPIVLKDKPYKVPTTLVEHRLRCININKPDFNDPKVGLRTDLTVEALLDQRRVHLQKTDYFSSSATNEMAGKQFVAASETRQGRPRLIYAVSDLIFDNHELLGLNESSLSNHIGVSTLVITADNFLVLQDQGQQTDSPNETAVGASGSADGFDITETQIGDPTLQGLVRHAMEREAKEELSATFTTGRKNTTLTGYARYLARGGKPEFFGISRTSAYLNQLQPTKADMRFVSGIWGRPFEPSPQGLLSTIEALLSEGKTQRRRYSLSMIVCLRMAQDHLRRMPPHIKLG
ncbi:hypothetical protein ABFT80_18065 [Mesorhizobium sp. SB112]|uniref:hypothetical protein n=1 Tax=Mesorhizobium sp. SB112 TaxID=3151853 RepID=UPI003264795B